MASLLQSAQIPELERLCDTASDLILFPVRHHSPLCARLIAELIDQQKPAAVLIEGPSDFNNQIQEMILDHHLPLAIYSWCEVDGIKRGAYYPYCDYSPEYQAIIKGLENDALVEFIDLPWSSVISEDDCAQRYNDNHLKGKFIKNLCEEIGVDNFNDLWDRMFECPNLSLDQFLERMHSYCIYMRQLGEVENSDQMREAFMAERIRAVRAQIQGTVLVITGGYHSLGILQNLAKELPDCQLPQISGESVLTPYSYERLDCLKGYEAGMPNPGFYDAVWNLPHEDLFPSFMQEVADTMRAKKQVISTADLIALRTSAVALASMRGQQKVWRRELLDAVQSTLIKDDLIERHPYIEAVNEILRGNRRGRLSKRAKLPPLVSAIENRLKEQGIHLEAKILQLKLDLTKNKQLQKSRLLHCLKSLGIRGISCTRSYKPGNTDIDDASEEWRLAWNVDFIPSCIEASQYGSHLEEATLNALYEKSCKQDQNAINAATLLLESVLCGLKDERAVLQIQLEQAIDQESAFISLSQALSSLFFLFHYDRHLGVSGHLHIGMLLQNSWSRALWLLDSLTSTNGEDDSLDGVNLLLAIQRRADGQLNLSRNELMETFERVAQDNQAKPSLRGVVCGGLWVLGHREDNFLLKQLRSFSAPDILGDFVYGLFKSARECLNRDKELLQELNRFLLEYSHEEFLQALPALRLAFSLMPPREKNRLLDKLFRQKPQQSLTMNFSNDELAEALGLQDKIRITMQTYGLNNE